ncbi:MAG: aminotransferase class V-fold PLP-dependent enzyme, partial [bacterium]|nr:aminotransferase class V-fold PLP-dependent enzyme [bacterium]
MAKRYIFLDHNSTTPCDSRVVEEMLPFFSDQFANPSSVNHRAGREAFEAIEQARRRVAQSIGA